MPKEYTPIPEERTLKDLQEYQNLHDEIFHPDVYNMSPDKQVQHIYHHIGKINGRFADYFDKRDHKEFEEASEIMKEIKGQKDVGKRAIDLLVLSLMLGNRLGLNLEDEYFKRVKQLEDQRMDS